MAKLTWNDCTVAPQSALYGWADDKALDVHEGMYREDGTISPARRWTDVGLQNCDPMATFLEHFKGSPAQAFQDMAGELNQAFQSAIAAPIYVWDNITIRSDGTMVGSPRDVIDTGELYRSQYLILMEGL